MFKMSIYVLDFEIIFEHTQQCKKNMYFDPKNLDKKK